MVKILTHNKNIPIANKEKNTVLFFWTSTLFIIVLATLSLQVFGAVSSWVSLDEDIATFSVFGGSWTVFSVFSLFSLFYFFFVKNFILFFNFE